MNIKSFQFKVIDGDVKKNISKIKELFNDTDLSGTDVVVLPEMWTSGYDLENIRQHAEHNLYPILDVIKKLAAENNVNIIAGSVPNIKKDEEVLNTAFVVDRKGSLVHEYSKIHLVPMLNEPEYLSAGEERAEVFELESEKMGVLICYDLRFPELFRDLALTGAKVIFVVAEWPAERSDHWLTLLKARAIENQCYIVSCNTSGSQSDGTTFAGKSLIVDPFGVIISEAGHDTEENISADLDLPYIDRIRRDIPIFSSRRTELYRHL
ncbi:carbon-nitrogen family hydrolase [Corticicoccus populi]|uniref:Carbon-nitrogen family hydrolase n=1 Tax=Corticicoccus populi TaxID=1812821 RepID=A0ABW5WYU2_9STAP